MSKPSTSETADQASDDAGGIDAGDMVNELLIINSELTQQMASHRVTLRQQARLIAGLQEELAAKKSSGDPG